MTGSYPFNFSAGARAKLEHFWWDTEFMNFRPQKIDVGDSHSASGGCKMQKIMPSNVVSNFCAPLNA